MYDRLINVTGNKGRNVTMIQTGRMAALMARKAQLESELQQESNRRYPDQIRVTTLKRRKLIIKEELNQIAQAS
jgi:hypothetical protein